VPKSILSFNRANIKNSLRVGTLLNKKIMISLSSIILLLLSAFAIMFYFNNDQKLKTLQASQYPSPPAKTPIEKITTDILHDESKWTTNNTHDAEIIKVNGWYYTFSTDYSWYTSARYSNKKI
jgi:arabinan endo-1,5-alpha-L-arabinosidase